MSGGFSKKKLSLSVPQPRGPSSASTTYPSMSSTSPPPSPSVSMDNEIVEQEISEHVEKLRALRSSLGPIPDNANMFQVDSHLWRFLKAAKLDIEIARTNIMHHFTWRETNIDPTFAYMEIDELKEFYPHGWCGVDKLGRPVYIEKLGKLSMSNVMRITTPERLAHHFVQDAEYSMTHRYVACSLRQGRVIDKSLLVWDLRGVEMKHMTDKRVIDLIRTAIKSSGKHFPETCGKVLVLNTPKTFELIWKVVKNMLDPKTLLKIEMSEGIGSLHQYVDLDQLSTELGGTNLCKWPYEEIGPWREPGFQNLLTRYSSRALLGFVLNNELPQDVSSIFEHQKPTLNPMEKVDYNNNFVTDMGLLSDRNFNKEEFPLTTDELNHQKFDDLMNLNSEGQGEGTKGEISGAGSFDLLGAFGEKESFIAGEENHLPYVGSITFPYVPDDALAPNDDPLLHLSSAEGLTIPPAAQRSDLYNAYSVYCGATSSGPDPPESSQISQVTIFDSEATTLPAAHASEEGGAYASDDWVAPMRPVAVGEYPIDLLSTLSETEVIPSSQYYTDNLFMPSVEPYSTHNEFISSGDPYSTHNQFMQDLNAHQHVAEPLTTENNFYSTFGLNPRGMTGIKTYLSHPGADPSPEAIGVYGQDALSIRNLTILHSESAVDPIRVLPPICSADEASTRTEMGSGFAYDPLAEASAKQGIASAPAIPDTGAGALDDPYAGLTLESAAYEVPTITEMGSGFAYDPFAEVSADQGIGSAPAIPDTGAGALDDPYAGPTLESAAYEVPTTTEMSSGFAYDPFAEVSADQGVGSAPIPDTGARALDDPYAGLTLESAANEALIPEMGSGFPYGPFAEASAEQGIASALATPDTNAGITNDQNSGTVAYVEQAKDSVVISSLVNDEVFTTTDPLAVDATTQAIADTPDHLCFTDDLFSPQAPLESSADIVQEGRGMAVGNIEDPLKEEFQQPMDGVPISNVEAGLASDPFVVEASCEHAGNTVPSSYGIVAQEHTEDAAPMPDGVAEFTADAYGEESLRMASTSAPLSDETAAGLASDACVEELPLEHVRECTPSMDAEAGPDGLMGDPLDELSLARDRSEIPPANVNERVDATFGPPTGECLYMPSSAVKSDDQCLDNNNLALKETPEGDDNAHDSLTASIMGENEDDIAPLEAVSPTPSIPEEIPEEANQLGTLMSEPLPVDPARDDGASMFANTEALEDTRAPLALDGGGEEPERAPLEQIPEPPSENAQDYPLSENVECNPPPHGRGIPMVENDLGGHMVEKNQKHEQPDCESMHTKDFIQDIYSVRDSSSVVPSPNALTTANTATFFRLNSEDDREMPPNQDTLVNNNDFQNDNSPLEEEEQMPAELSEEAKEILRSNLPNEILLDIKESQEDGGVPIFDPSLLPNLGTESYDEGRDDDDAQSSDTFRLVYPPKRASLVSNLSITHEGIEPSDAAAAAENNDANEVNEAPAQGHLISEPPTQEATRGLGCEAGAQPNPDRADADPCSESKISIDTTAVGSVMDRIKFFEKKETSSSSSPAHSAGKSPDHRFTPKQPTRSQGSDSREPNESSVGTPSPKSNADQPVEAPSPYARPGGVLCEPSSDSGDPTPDHIAPAPNEQPFEHISFPKESGREELLAIGDSEEALDSIADPTGYVPGERIGITNDPVAEGVSLETTKQDMGDVNLFPENGLGEAPIIEHIGQAPEAPLAHPDDLAAVAEDDVALEASYAEAYEKQPLNSVDALGAGGYDEAPIIDQSTEAADQIYDQLEAEIVEPAGEYFDPTTAYSEPSPIEQPIEGTRPYGGSGFDEAPKVAGAEDEFDLFFGQPEGVDSELAGDVAAPMPEGAPLETTEQDMVNADFFPESGLGEAPMIEHTGETPEAPLAQPDDLPAVAAGDEALEGSYAEAYEKQPLNSVDALEAGRHDEAPIIDQSTEAADQFYGQPEAEIVEPAGEYFDPTTTYTEPLPVEQPIEATRPSGGSGFDEAPKVAGSADEFDSFLGQPEVVDSELAGDVAASILEGPPLDSTEQDMGDVNLFPESGLGEAPIIEHTGQAPEPPLARPDDLPRVAAGDVALEGSYAEAYEDQPLDTVDALGAGGHDEAPIIDQSREAVDQFYGRPEDQIVEPADEYLDPTTAYTEPLPVEQPIEATLPSGGSGFDEALMVAGSADEFDSFLGQPQVMDNKLAGDVAASILEGGPLETTEQDMGDANLVPESGLGEIPIIGHIGEASEARLAQPDDLRAVTAGDVALEESYAEAYGDQPLDTVDALAAGGHDEAPIIDQTDQSREAPYQFYDQPVAEAVEPAGEYFDPTTAYTEPLPVEQPIEGTRPFGLSGFEEAPLVAGSADEFDSFLGQPEVVVVAEGYREQQLEAPDIDQDFGAFGWAEPTFEGVDQPITESTVAYPLEPPTEASSESEAFETPTAHAEISLDNPADPKQVNKDDQPFDNASRSSSSSSGSSESISRSSSSSSSSSSSGASDGVKVAGTPTMEQQSEAPASEQDMPEDGEQPIAAEAALTRGQANPKTPTSAAEHFLFTPEASDVDEGKAGDGPKRKLCQTTRQTFGPMISLVDQAGLDDREPEQSGEHESGKPSLYTLWRDSEHEVIPADKVQHGGSDSKAVERIQQSFVTSSSHQDWIETERGLAPPPPPPSPPPPKTPPPVSRRSSSSRKTRKLAASSSWQEDDEESVKEKREDREVAASSSWRERDPDKKQQADEADGQDEQDWKEGDYDEQDWKEGDYDEQDWKEGDYDEQEYEKEWEEENIADEDVEEFQRYFARVHELRTKNPGQSGQFLYLGALLAQSVQGDCSILSMPKPKGPPTMDYLRWAYWRELQGTPKKEAMTMYIEIAKKLLELNEK